MTPAKKAEDGEKTEPLKISVYPITTYSIDYVELTDEEAMNRPLLLNPPRPPLLGNIFVKLNHGQATEADLDILKRFNIEVEIITEEEAVE